MRKINVKEHILPHAIAVLVFFIVTLVFFSPVFFENKAISQHDIQQGTGLAKSLADYRKATGKEGLWAMSAFSGMPAYLVSVQWSEGAVANLKRVMSLFLPHPVDNIFLAFLCYYILLLAFGVRPWLAIGGALAFGLSSYMIIGLSAGHNARIGAIVFMPLVLAGIHLVFSGKKVLGFGTTTLGLSLQLRENHLQMTYYLVLLVVVYGLVQMVAAWRNKQWPGFLRSLVVLIPAAVIAAGTFFGQFWSITEYGRYSIRGPSELVKKNTSQSPAGLSKSYAFEYSNAIWEPMTLLVPNFYGGSSSNFLVQDPKSNVYNALVNSGDNKLANQLANYTGAYWGGLDGTAGAYYAGAIICFLFVLGILLAPRKYVWWLVPLSAFAIVLTWGDNFSTFNYFLFDYFPGYSKFRSPTFALIIVLIAMPLLGFIGLEVLFQRGVNKETKRQLLMAFAVTGGLCLLLVLFGGVASFQRTGESSLPQWFLNALMADRKGLLRADALRSLAFVVIVFAVLYFDLPKKISMAGFLALLVILLLIDLVVVDKRYFTKENYHRKSDLQAFTIDAADQEIAKDPGYYRVYNLQNPWNEGRTSYYHNSLGGYHGVKLRRYQDLYDSALIDNTRKFIRDAQANALDFKKYGVLNMLNAKYIVFGPDANNFIPNPGANGNAWFVRKIDVVHSPTEELRHVNEIDTRNVAVVDDSHFKTSGLAYDSGSIAISEVTPPLLKYKSESAGPGFVVFSEIYYPKGWVATIDGKEVPILRADYVLRALEVPAGKHEIEFRFEPKPYVVGNTITMASSWVALLVVLGCLGWSLKNPDEPVPA
jgi:hypothetical protein